MNIGNAQILGDREEQQDYFASFEVKRVTFLIIADGMGGHQGGAQASRVALRIFSEQIRHSKLNNIPSELRAALEVANHSLLACQPEFPGLGTTLVVLAVKNKRAWWISVGDSPLYRLRDNNLERLNENHSVAGELNKAVEAGELTQEEAILNPNYHAIYSVLSGSKIPLIDCPDQGVKVKKNDRFILASDGIHTLKDSEIKQVVAKTSQPQQAANAIVETITKRSDDGQDNCTVITFYGSKFKWSKTLLSITLVLALGIGGFLYCWTQNIPKTVSKVNAEKPTIEIIENEKIEVSGGDNEPGSSKIETEGIEGESN